LGTGRFRCSDGAACTPLVFDDDRLAEFLAHALTHNARHDIGGAAWGKGHDEPDGLIREIGLGGGRRGHAAQCKQHHGQKCIFQRKCHLICLQLTLRCGRTSFYGLRLRIDTIIIVRILRTFPDGVSGSCPAPPNEMPGWRNTDAIFLFAPYSRRSLTKRSTYALAGCSRISDGVPTCSTRPSRRMTIRSPSRSAS